MSDADLRSLERAASDDPAAAERLIAERIRAGGRDPRRDPRMGDLLSVPSPTWHDPQGAPLPLQRLVTGGSDERTVKLSFVRWVAQGPLAPRTGGFRTSSLADWRRWARRARVLALAPPPPACSECGRFGGVPEEWEPGLPGACATCGV